ncbi:MAG TPA: preprotein translocase subunit SecG [Puia sp.]|jgi:preprotein translocase subunit SecG|nr:preprotein translocase subunit SecG [Puia sp.]
MTFLLVLLIIVACVFLGLIILVQNPKGGGLAGNVGGFSNQLMGVKQTTDVLEKGTWVLAVIVSVLCLFSSLVVPKASASSQRGGNQVTVPTQTQQVPARPGQ